MNPLRLVELLRAIEARAGTAAKHLSDTREATLTEWVDPVLEAASTIELLRRPVVVGSSDSGLTDALAEADDQPAAHTVYRATRAVIRQCVERGWLWRHTVTMGSSGPPTMAFTIDCGDGEQAFADVIEASKWLDGQVSSDSDVADELAEARARRLNGASTGGSGHDATIGPPNLADLTVRLIVRNNPQGEP